MSDVQQETAWGRLADVPGYDESETYAVDYGGNDATAVAGQLYRFDPTSRAWRNVGAA